MKKFLLCMMMLLVIGCADSSQTPPPTPVPPVVCCSGTLAWSANDAKDLVLGYRVYRSTTLNNWVKGQDVLNTTANLTYTDTTAIEGIRYYYVITAFNGPDPVNESLFSNQVDKLY